MKTHVAYWKRFKLLTPIWIDLKVEKPKIGELVLLTVFDKNPENQWVVSGHRARGGKYFNQFMDSSIDADIYPTHWMPHPEPIHTDF